VDHAKDAPCCAPQQDRTPVAIEPPPRAANRSTRGQVRRPGGGFAMGDAFGEGYAADGELPVHRVELPPFHIDATAVTNAQFAAPLSDVSRRQNHPVVQVSWRDAAAYAAWAAKRLPTEAEWEYAARGGLDGQRFPWGDDLATRGRWRCNIWQGRFPDHNTQDDGYLTTAPVKAYAPNGHGLWNTSGNVWEWVR